MSDDSTTHTVSNDTKAKPVTLADLEKFAATCQESFPSEFRCNESTSLLFRQWMEQNNVFHGVGPGIPIGIVLTIVEPSEMPDDWLRVNDQYGKPLRLFLLVKNEFGRYGQMKEFPLSQRPEPPIILPPEFEAYR